MPCADELRPIQVINDQRTKSFIKLPFESDPVVPGACAPVLCLGVGFLLLALYRSSRAPRASRKSSTTWRDVPAPNIAERAAGLRSRRSTSFTCVEQPDRPPEGMVTVISDSLASYTSPEGRKVWFLTEPAGRLLPEENSSAAFTMQVSPRRPRPANGSRPLRHLRHDPAGAAWRLIRSSRKAEPIKGTDGLIDGLSGKFLSSIVVWWRQLLHALGKIPLRASPQQRLRGSGQRTLSPHPGAERQRVLIDIQRLCQQPTSLTNISSDIVHRFVNVFHAFTRPCDRSFRRHGSQAAGRVPANHATHE